MPLHPQTTPSLASFKSRLVLPFWYRLTQVALEKEVVKRVCVCVWVATVMAATAHIAEVWRPPPAACYRLRPAIAKCGCVHWPRGVGYESAPSPWEIRGPPCRPNTWFPWTIASLPTRQHLNPIGSLVFASSSSSSSQYIRLFKSCQTQLIQNTSIERKEIEQWWTIRSNTNH